MEHKLAFADGNLNKVYSYCASSQWERVSDPVELTEFVWFCITYQTFSVMSLGMVRSAFDKRHTARLWGQYCLYADGIALTDRASCVVCYIYGLHRLPALDICYWPIHFAQHWVWYEFTGFDINEFYALNVFFSLMTIKQSGVEDGNSTLHMVTPLWVVFKLNISIRWSWPALGVVCACKREERHGLILGTEEVQ